MNLGDLFDLAGYGDSYGETTIAGSGGLLITISTVIIVIIAILGALALYFFFSSTNAEEKNFKGFTLFLHKFLNFKVLISEGLLRIGYVYASIYLVLMTFVHMMQANFVSALLSLIAGVFGTRIVFEVIMAFFQLCSNVKGIKEGESEEEDLFNNKTEKLKEKMFSKPEQVVVEPAPVVVEPAPVVAEPAPVVAEPAPVVVEPAPVVEEVVPVVAEPAPVVEVVTEKKCTNCGRQLDMEDVFCPECGTKN